ncbi:MAG: hypothetical protein QOE73_1124 [Verrucomicrobiota bacterium]
MITYRESGEGGRSGERDRSIRNYALERGFVRPSNPGRPAWKRSAGPALPDLLASDFRFCLQPRLRGERRAGSDAGFFCHGA